ncbi:MAG: Ldh family oxidoreductase [Balneolaceae bacterium]
MISIEEKQERVKVSTGRYDLETIKQLVINIATASGFNKPDAAIFADALVEADLNGTSTHGVSRLNIYMKRVQKGLINPKAELKVERQRGSTLVLDADNGLGQVQAMKALDLLMPLSRSNGIAACTIRNSQHFGALSYYCNKVTEKDMILFATTNCEPSLAPEGASEAYFGTNPLASSFPTGKGYPVKIDLATSLVARGNIIAAQKNGESIPENWALTKEGEPTTDPAAALEGAMRPMAAHKGSALALMVEIFSSVLSGAAIGPSVGSMYNQMDRKQDVGHFFALMDISAFMDPSVFKHRMDHTMDQIKSSKKRPDTEEILIPGERSFKRAQQNREQGITIDASTLAEIKSLCQQLEIEYILD